MIQYLEEPGCPVCGNSIVIFVTFMGTICGFMLVLSIIKIIRYQCMQPGRRNANRMENSTPRFKAEGLASSVIISLPAVQFKKKRRESCDDGEKNSECAICLGEFQGGEWMRLLPNCAHSFHVSCVDIWLRSSSICPLCRTDVLADETNLQLAVHVASAWETLHGEEAPHESYPSPRVDRAVGNEMRDDVK